ncbi:AMP-dependent synthetase and ligase [Phellopilus nigrolimitatus]|nr:AMP-dependent synthetase and ligase [Phellopilus nigrolimitatus]
MADLNLLPSTLPELLLARCRNSSAQIGFLNSNGDIIKSLSYSSLFDDAQKGAQRLLAAGLRPNADIVLTGIRICPIPPLHPDESRQILFFEHLQTIRAVNALVPHVKTISFTELEGLDVDETSRASVFPARCPKPDDTVCLMLTSGSTGNCKGVVLRHSNLLSSIRGKIKHHRTSAASRFLNWIAFDHVACVSEVHLQALEANASQYHVSPSAIISYPRRLLDWCSTLHISYTFSPNFLLAQICRDAAAIPYADGSLDLSCIRVFISGGEAVPVNTAVEFSNIIERFGAPRDSLRGGFGMTETGAGCIYDVRPVVRDVQQSSDKYLSLGKCCNGTSMRTVDTATGLECAPLESGQFQLKGPTIFREYYNNPEATAESFSADGWFITGDTAQVGKDGNLHLMGRDKDCININGVKHPSVDVEHYIEDAKIVGVTKSFVYVCPTRLPEADTETYAVFYLHSNAEDGLSEESIHDIAATNRMIRNTCAVFCAQAPHVILPLPRKSFVKTALGKISRSALAKTYLGGGYTTLENQLLACDAEISANMQDMPRNAVEEVVFESIASIFKIDKSVLTSSHSLFDIGASSMHLMRLKHFLQERLNIADLPTIEMLRRPEIGQLCDYLSEITASSGIDSVPVAHYSPLVCFNRHGSKPPLFLIHPGVGEVLVFINLARALSDDRPVYALRARGFDPGEQVFASFGEMVNTYVAAIEECNPGGPYFLAGYSFGGAVAFEIGKKLESRGKHVSWLGILNLPPHIQFRMKELVWVEVMINLLMFLSLIPSSAFGPLKSDLYRVFPESKLTDEEPACAAQIIDWLLDRSDRARLDELSLNTSDFRRWAHIAYELSSSGRHYEPAGCVRSALTTVFCAIPLPSMGTRDEFKRDRLSVWKDFSGDRFEMVDVDGEHYTMLAEEHVVSFAEKMRNAMECATELS